jgi:hypothetical protein
MASPTVEQARAAFRERHISQNYSGPLHLATTVSISLFIALLSAMMLEDVTLLEWLTIPLTFLHANLCEYFGHKEPMHHKRRLMTRYNFNITYPICDFLFGTVYEDND